jgi:hypothetical protein
MTLPLHILIALATSTAAPAYKPVATPSRPAVSSPAKAKAKPQMDPMEAMAMMTKMFDKFFPAGPDPDPARLAVARGAVMTMFPKGAYAEAMNGFTNRTIDTVLNMSEADFLAMVPSEKAKSAKVPSTEPLRLSLAKKEPLFDAKLAAVRAFAGAMFVKFGDVAEPKFREGMARALARKFDARQLGEIEAFLATPTGAAYGREMVGMWFEPDVMRGSLEAMPEMMKLAPELMKDAATFEAEMKATAKPAADKKPD